MCYSPNIDRKNAVIIGNRVIDIVFSDESAVLPVTSEEVKSYCNIDYPDWDDLINDILIKAACEAVEGYCNVSIVDRTVTALIQVESEQLLPYGPVKVPAEIIIKDSNGNVLTGINKIGLSFIHITSPGLFEVQYTAGYGTVPASLKHAVCAKVLAGFENRGDKFVDHYDGIYKQLVNPFIRKL